MDRTERLWLRGLPDTWRQSDHSSAHSTRTLATDPPSATSDTQPPPLDSADAYVQLALEHNPSIRAAVRRVERMGYVVPQSTSLDDPMFNVAPIGEMAQTASGEVGLMTSLSQRFPFPGKLDSRGRIAQQDVAIALADLHQRRLEVINDTRRTYWNFYFSSRALETTRRSRQLLENLRQIAQTEYATGARPQQDVLRANVELGVLDNELVTLTQQQDTARAMLNQLMDRPIDSPLDPPPPADLLTVELQLDHLLADAAQHNPAIIKAQHRIEQFQERKRLATLGRYPDFTLSATYNAVEDEGLSMAANGDDQWWLGAGFNLPIWFQKYEAAEREALRGILESVSELTAERNRIAFRVRDALLTVDAQQRIASLFRDTIIPQATQAVDVSQSGYRAGTLDFLTLVDNWRKLLNYELMYHRALANLEQAFADLERAVGRNLARRSLTPDNPPLTPTPPATGS
jgi:outer membrane protein TolC